jgi:hypothetical protein
MRKIVVIESLTLDGVMQAPATGVVIATYQPAEAEPAVGKGASNA